ncbi:MAG: type II toxin-antitoxin system VapC family toxin [Acidimicrobiaceae bacterium]|nr:type II toxin-antitoxin system VapC family toxin [Acidimicrobiia bacterium]MCY4493113.1 type II toxin-antitoxin system VapC family toxin [Acidimicrobiaceae bacterium]
MIVLDTNVVSELIRRSPDPAVAAWVADHDAATLFVTAIGEAELRYGVAILPAGRRRKMLAAAVDLMLREDLAGHILPFDSAAAHAYATIASERRAIGRPAAQADAQIAAIARSRGMAVATRNIKDLQGMGVNLVNPWETPAHQN